MNKLVTKKSSLTFSERVVKATLSIPPGKVSTYGRIARAAGGGGPSAQSVTAVLGKAYQAGEVNIPFHRIVYADGRVWVNSRNKTERLKRYKKEGILVDKKGRISNFIDVLFEF